MISDKGSARESLMTVMATLSQPGAFPDLNELQNVSYFLAARWYKDNRLNSYAWCKKK